MANVFEEDHADGVLREIIMHMAYIYIYVI